MWKLLCQKLWINIVCRIEKITNRIIGESALVNLQGFLVYGDLSDLGLRAICDRGTCRNTIQKPEPYYLNTSAVEINIGPKPFNSVESELKQLGSWFQPVKIPYGSTRGTR
jgi:hypothetical protein